MCEYFIQVQYVQNGLNVQTLKDIKYFVFVVSLGML